MTYVGFTGTRRGMSHAQFAAFTSILIDLQPQALIHGDCVGADAEANHFATKLGLKICIHPPVEDALRAFCQGNWIGMPRSYYQRNKAIVDACEVLIACPGSTTPHGGTWSTIRIADRLKKPVFVIYPDGTTVLPGAKR